MLKKYSNNFASLLFMSFKLNVKYGLEKIKYTCVIYELEI
jgi:hypothetical protein